MTLILPWACATIAAAVIMTSTMRVTNSLVLLLTAIAAMPVIAFVVCLVRMGNRERRDYATCIELRSEVFPLAPRATVFTQEDVAFANQLLGRSGR